MMSYPIADCWVASASGVYVRCELEEKGCFEGARSL
jgi:hypothetical protein